MYNLESISLTAQCGNIYIVRFGSDAAEVEYTFTVHDQPFLSIECELQ